MQESAGLSLQGTWLDQHTDCRSGYTDRDGQHRVLEESGWFFGVFSSVAYDVF